MASSSFRDSMNSLGWSRRDPDLPINTAHQTGGLLSSIKSLNPFGDSGYVRLPTTEGAGAPLPGRNRREEEEGWFAISLFLAILKPYPASLVQYESKHPKPLDKYRVDATTRRASRMEV
ncbi:protein transport protein sft2 [Ciborinia camelliae]|nr:protein transport protein sft2 [Ciborinia camelliae]